MRRWFVAALAATVLAVGLVAQTGSSSGSSADGSSSSGSSSNGSSSNGSSSGDSSNGSSSGGSSSGDSSGGSSSGGSSGGGDDGDGTTEIPGPSVTLPPLPEQFTLPRPDEGDDEVQVPEDPPRELEGKSARERLAALPPVPRRCLDPDLTLLDVFVPGAAIPLRLAYCLLYVGTIARFLGEVDGGSSSARSVEPAPTRTAEGDTVRVPLVQPPRTQRPLATLALLLLIVVVSITIGYVLGQRRAEREAALDRRARGL